MKLILPRHYNCHDKKNQYNEKKSLKILKKMAKLEKKLKRYSINDTSSDDDSPASSRSTSRSRSPSKSRNKRTSRRLGKQEKHFGFYDRIIVSDSDSNLSGSASLRSISEHKSRHHRTSRSLQRSRSFTGFDNYSPTLLTKRHYSHRHSYRLQHCDRLRPRYQNGILGCLFRILAQSEPNLHSTLNEIQDEDVQQILQQPSRFADCESKISDTIPINKDEAMQEINEPNDDLPLDNSAQETQVDRILSDDSLKIIQNGLPLDTKKDLLNKYRISKNCILLKGPEINEEILPTVTKSAIRTDVLQMYEQNQIGAGLVALGQAISDLNDKTELKKDKDIVDILETLNEAAAIILDVHHNMTIKRQLIMLPKLNKRVRPFVKDCKADELLYGNNFKEKIKNAKIFGKGRKIYKNKISENLCDKEEKYKHHDYDSERLKKRLDSSGLYKKSI